MGNAHSPPHGDPRFASASRAFTHTELEDLKSLLESLAARSHSDSQFISPSVFQTYLGLPGPLGDRMFDLVTQQRKDQKLTFENLVVAKGTYEKGTTDDIEEFIYKLLDINGDGVLGRLYWDIWGFERKNWTNTENCKIIIQAYIDCLHIKKPDKSRMLAEAQTEVENSLGGNSEEILFDEKRKSFVSAGHLRWLFTL